MSKHLQKALLEFYSYNSISGKLCVKQRSPKSRWKVGDEIGYVSPQGYRVAHIAGKDRYVHRVIWLMVHGYWPIEVDHINGNGLDNRIENLRDSKRHQNAANTEKTIRNTSGYKGVYRWPTGEWYAQIMHQGQHHYLGKFGDRASAAKAYRKASVRLNGEFSRV